MHQDRVAAVACDLQRVTVGEMQHAASRTRGQRVRFEFDDDIAIDDRDRFAVAPDIADLQDAAVVDEVDDVRGEIGAEDAGPRSEEHTSELQSLMRISYAVFCLKKKTQQLSHSKWNSTVQTSNNI